MSQKIEQTAGSGENKGPSKPSRQAADGGYRPRVWPALIVIGALAAIGVGGLLALVWASGAFADAGAGVSFVAQNTLALCFLLVVIAQACIYWRQRRVMIAQWKAMNDQLEAVAKQEGHLLTQANAAIEAVELAKGQLLAMQGQWKAMDDGLIETRNLVSQSITRTSSTRNGTRTSLFFQAREYPKGQAIGRTCRTNQGTFRLKSTGKRIGRKRS